MLSNDELMNIQGGAINIKLVVGIIGTALTFLIGVVDGFINPRKCNN